MATKPENNSGEKNSTEFKLFAAKRIFIGLVGIVLLLWLVSYALNFFDTPEVGKPAHTVRLADTGTGQDDDSHAAGDAAEHDAGPTQAAAGHGAEPDHATQAPPEAEHASAEPADEATPHAAAEIHSDTEAAAPAADHGAESPAEETDAHGAESPAQAPAQGAAGHGVVSAPDITGVAFVEAMIAPMDYELNERFFGWRPNDIIEWTDNVNNYQLGVLEVLRRTSEVLADRISRTGTTQAFEKELEKVRSNFNINADQYWLPSAEKSYGEALELLGSYKQKLMNGTAYFYNRSDNLIPLLRAYENLLGSCDDNLIKTTEDDGSEVSWFRADNYFYYAKGVAAAMHSILEAVAIDFARTIETRRGSEVLHHALEALHHATQIEPLVIFDSAPDGILANHRANMAAPISHARFYIGLLAETLST